MCWLGGDSGCAAPFYPGHRNMGSAWWAIGDKKPESVIKSVTTTLVIPTGLRDVSNLLSINTALENSVRTRLLRLSIVVGAPT